MPARSHSIFLSAALCAVLFIAVIARAADLSQTSSPTPDPLVQLLLDSAALCAVLFIAVIARAADLSQASSPTPDPPVQLLLDKGVITSAEADALRNGSAAERQTQLLKLLRDKGVLSATDYDSLTTPPAPSHVSTALVASTTPMLPPATQTAAPTPQPAKPEALKVIPAVAPLPALQLEPSKQDGMIPDLKLGSGARLKLYGMVKASLIYDSSSPYGTDMPLPGFISRPASSPNGSSTSVRGSLPRS